MSCVPFTNTDPSRISTVSPPIPITRLMKGSPFESIHVSGGLNTTTSPRL